MNKIASPAQRIVDYIFLSRIGMGPSLIRKTLRAFRCGKITRCSVPFLTAVPTFQPDVRMPVSVFRGIRKKRPVLLGYYIF